MRRIFANERLTTTFAIIAVLSICVPFSIGAYFSFPIWDDGQVWLTIREHGVAAIPASLPDRPVLAHVWAALAGSEAAFWRSSLLAQMVLWPCLALLSALLWQRLFPQFKKYSVVVAVLSVSSLLTQIQLLTANMALVSVLTVTGSYLALILLLRFVDTATRVGYVSFFIGLGALFFSVQLTEYAVSVSAVSVVILLSYLHPETSRQTKARAITAIIATVVVAGISYAIFVNLGGGTRADVQPTHALEIAKDNLLNLPFRLAAALWNTVLGGPMRALAEFDFYGGRAQLAAAVYGCLTAGLVLLAVGVRRGDVSDLALGRNSWTALMVFLSLAAGLAPVVAMGRAPSIDGMSSRFAIPVAPIAAIFIVYTLLLLIRSRYWSVPVLFVGFVAGSLAASDAWESVVERRMMSAVGAALRPHVTSSSDLSVAVLTLPERALGPRYEWELTARIAASWPEELRRKFWAFDAQRSQLVRERFGSRSECVDNPKLDFKLRLVERKGMVGTLLWVTPEQNIPLRKTLSQSASVLVEPYCIDERGLTPGQVGSLLFERFMPGNTQLELRSR